MPLAKAKGRPTLKHCLEAKPFEPQAEILLPTSDAMLAFISSGLLTHPEMTDAGNTFQVMIGNDKDFLATRVSYNLDLRGPSMDIQTGCSTSLVAVHQACQALLSFQCDVALAGGVSVDVPQRTVRRGVPQRGSPRQLRSKHCVEYFAGQWRMGASQHAHVIVRAV